MNVRLAARGRLTVMLALLLFGSGCGPVHTTLQPSAEQLSGVKTVAVVVPSDRSFTVLLDRSKATAGPAIMFGLIGASVASAYNSSLDRDKAKLLTPHLAGFSTRATFVDAFQKAIRESQRPIDATLVEKALSTEEARRYDAVLTLTIQDWGLRLPAASESDRLAGFIEVAARMVMPRGDQILWDEHDTVLGQGRHAFAAYQEDAALLRGELTETIETAGGRLAARLVYPRGGTK